MDADANDVTGVDGAGIDLLKGFVNQDGGSGRWGSGCGQNE